MAESLLSGCRALDLTDEKGFVCGKILAALGVDVIKIEKPGGDPARNTPPYYHDIPDPEKSLYWMAFNTDKHAITLNIETRQGQDLFRRLAENADFVVESFSPGYLDRLGLGYEALRLMNPRIIVTSITSFGQNGPHSHYKGCELVASAMSGVLDNTGDPDRPPVKEALDSTYFQAGAAAALGTLISYYHCEMTGEGQQVDVSLQEVAASRTTSCLMAWQFDRLLLKRLGPRTTLGLVASRWNWPCKDGFLFWHMLGGLFGAPANRALSQWIDEEETENALRQVTNWDEFDKASMTQETYNAFEKTIGNFFLKHTKKEIAEESLKRGVNACVANDPADVLANAHLAARSYWVGLKHPELGMTLNFPKYFFLCNETENFVACRASAIGADNDEIYRKELGLSSMEVASLKRANVI